MTEEQVKQKELSKKHKAFIAKYFEHYFNGTKAYMDVYEDCTYASARTLAAQLLANVDIRAEIDRQMAGYQVGAEEAVARLSEMTQADLGTFFKIVEEWTFFPLPTYEIIDAKEVTDDSDDDKKPVVRTSYFVRHIAIDLEKVMDPRYSRLLRKFTDSPKSGLGIELHDPQAALDKLLRVAGKYKDIIPEEKEAPKPAPTFSLPADVLAPSFIKSYRAVRSGLYTEFLEDGGRGSTKSTFISLMIIELIKNNPNIHALATRQVKDTLRDSVFSQLQWAIGELGLTEEFKCTTNPLEITYLPTKQKIYFRGADDPGKIKSIKPAFGYIGILWFEELDQYRGAEAVRKIEQSMRGGELAYTFKSWNPPRTTASWVHKYKQIPKPKQYQHTSTYLDVPAEWLGQPWLDEAEHLKNVNPLAYEHEYLGIANGSGGQVFENVKIRKITDEEIAQFDQVLHGLDWGYFPDPFSYGRMHFDAARLTLYIYGEYRANKKSNRKVYDKLVELGLLRPADLIIADSAEPKSIADFRDYGAHIRGAEKGPDSIDYSMKWLQSLVAIVIDNERAPAHAEEFLNYELEQDKNGEFISAYPDKNNHAIDDTRYATNLIWRRKGQ